MRPEIARLRMMYHKTRNILIVFHQHNEFRGPWIYHSRCMI